MWRQLTRAAPRPCSGARSCTRPPCTTPCGVSAPAGTVQYSTVQYSTVQYSPHQQVHPHPQPQLLGALPHRPGRLPLAHLPGAGAEQTKYFFCSQNIFKYDKIFFRAGYPEQNPSRSGAAVADLSEAVLLQVMSGVRVSSLLLVQPPPPVVSGLSGSCLTGRRIRWRP